MIIWIIIGYFFAFEHVANIIMNEYCGILQKLNFFLR